MPNWIYALGLGVSVGLVFGVFVARQSAAQQPIVGGRLANVAHYLGAALFVSVAPTVLLAGVLYRYPLLKNLLLALTLLAFSAIALLLHAALELNAAGNKAATR